MRVTTRAAVSFSFSFVFAIFITHITLRISLAHSFYACLTPPIVVGVLLTCQSLDPEYKTMFFHMYFQEKKHRLGSIRYKKPH